MIRICLILAIAACAAANTWEKPSFCEKHACPKFKTVFRNKGYALRCYNGFWTATTKVKDVSPAASDYRAAFWRLFKYISGFNDQKMKIKMTVPVLQSSMYNISDKTFVANSSFYINLRKPPTPSDGNVTIKKAKPFCVYVKSFMANTMKRPSIVTKKIKHLYKELSEQKQIIMAPGFSVSASYSRPRPGSKTYNEVWVVAPRAPLYRVMWSKKHVSRRCYFAMKKDRYAMVDVKVNNPKAADFLPVFKKLESYMSGMNAANSTPERGSPFVIGTYVDASEISTAKVFYYLPADAPAPLDKDIKIVKAPFYCAYVKSFKGDIKDGSLVQKESVALMKFLKKWRQGFVPGKYYFAAYGSSKNHEVMVASI